MIVDVSYRYLLVPNDSRGELEVLSGTLIMVEVSEWYLSELELPCGSLIIEELSKMYVLVP